MKNKIRQFDTVSNNSEHHSKKGQLKCVFLRAPVIKHKEPKMQSGLMCHIAVSEMET